MQYINYNGALIPETEAPATVQDSVFRFEQGLFESMLVTDNQLQLASFHFARLQKGLEQFGYAIPLSFNAPFFEEAIHKTLLANPGHKHYRVRFQVSNRTQGFSYLIEVQPIDESVFTFNQEGWTLGIVETLFKEFGVAGNLKTINIRLYKDGAQLAAVRGWNDVLLEADNCIMESGSANIFWIKGNSLFTPPLRQGCIAGTMRQLLMQTISEHYTIEEKTLTRAELADAEEVFLTNAVRRIKWVKQIEHYTYSNRLSSEIYSLLFS